MRLLGALDKQPHAWQSRESPTGMTLSGMRGEAEIQADDVRTVRQCGSVAVETVRRRANAGADDAIDRLELETLKEVGKGGGMRDMQSAIEQVRLISS